MKWKKPKFLVPLAIVLGYACQATFLEAQVVTVPDETVLDRVSSLERRLDSLIAALAGPGDPAPAPVGDTAYWDAANGLAVVAWVDRPGAAEYGVAWRICGGQTLASRIHRPVSSPNGRPLADFGVPSGTCVYPHLFQRDADGALSEELLTALEVVLGTVTSPPPGDSLEIVSFQPIPETFHHATVGETTQMYGLIEGSDGRTYTCIDGELLEATPTYSGDARHSSPDVMEPLPGGASGGACSIQWSIEGDTGGSGGGSIGAALTWRGATYRSGG